MGTAKGKKADNEDEIVPTHTALRLAAQWLGVSADDAIGNLEGLGGGEEGSVAEERKAGGHQAHPGLGFGAKKASFVSKSKANGVWNRKLDERLLNQKKRRESEGSGRVGRVGRAEVGAAGSESESEGEGLGESRVAMVGTKQKTAFTRDQLLLGGISKRRKKKGNKT